LIPYQKFQIVEHLRQARRILQHLARFFRLRQPIVYGFNIPTQTVQLAAHEN